MHTYDASPHIMKLIVDFYNDTRGRGAYWTGTKGTCSECATVCLLYFGVCGSP